VLRRLVDPDTKIVTLTITEKGYGANLQTRKLDISDPDIAYDLSNPKNAPRSVVGVLTRAITQRAVNKTPQFTCLSCDNLSHNGTLLKSVLMNFAQHTGDAALVGIVQSMSFPSSMVDRITPATTASDIDFVSDEYGVSDKCLVVAEPFFQWVIEDDFPMGRPDWTLAGAEFVSDVTAHEKMKLRMLNGAHSILAAIGQTLGARTIAQTVRLPDVENFVSRYWSEVAKTVSDDLDTHSYAQQLLARFQNSALEHRVDQIASDVSKKIQQRLVPPFREFNSASDVIGLGLAIVIRACGLHNDVGDAIHFSDPEVGSKIPRLDFSKQLSQDIIAPYLGNEVETNQVMHWLSVLQRNGLAHTLRRFNQNMT
jgi:fructuronate reductase